LRYRGTPFGAVVDFLTAFDWFSTTLNPVMAHATDARVMACQTVLNPKDDA
jgi:hypothetical protein